jgi:hypothetical protein
MKRSIHQIIFVLALTVAPFSSVSPVLAQGSPDAPLPGLIISEVQTGGLTGTGAEDGRQEFIELYNPHTAPYGMDGMQLQYLSANYMGTGDPTRVLAVLAGTVQPGGFAVISYPSYLADADLFFTVPASASSSGLLARTGGRVRLVNDDGGIADLVGWGSAAAISPWWRSVEIPPGTSIQRSLPGDGDYTSGLTYKLPTDNPTPGRAGSLPPPGDSEPIPDPPPNTCNNVELSEILPNAAGADTGKEFIEIHNLTSEAISLQGCQLQIGTGAPYVLPAETLPGAAYRAFYDSLTDLILPNATGQSVRLTTAEGTQEVIYVDNMKDDTSWAFIEGVWQVTTLATPDAPNKAGATHNEATSPTEHAATILPCAPGKERNPETNRCRNVTTAATSTECKPGQERNLATNRCRALAAGPTNTLTPCNVNQKRSPETNRYRAVQAATSELKACPEGQERNPLTNRCRKVAVNAANNFATVKDVPGSTLAHNYRWWIAASVLLGGAAYAVYEWRHDLTSMLYRLKHRWRQK